MNITDDSIDLAYWPLTESVQDNTLHLRFCQKNGLKIMDEIMLKVDMTRDAR